MILLIKQKCNYYRRFELDIWGLSYVDSKANEVEFKKSWFIFFFLRMFKERMANKWKRMRRYIYRIDIIDIRRRKKKWNKRWVSLRLTRLYFLTLQDHQFRMMFRKANKMSGDLESNYCHLLECRLFPLTYRTNFLPNMFLALDFCKKKRLFINYKTINYVNAIIPVGTFITARKLWRKWIKFQFLKRLKLKAVLFNTPRYFFMSWQYYFLYMLRKPRKKDFVYPIAIDIQRITGFY